MLYIKGAWFQGEEVLGSLRCGLDPFAGFVDDVIRIRVDGLPYDAFQDLCALLRQEGYTWPGESRVLFKGGVEGVILPVTRIRRAA